jgi:hypothetical protein
MLDLLGQRMSIVAFVTDAFDRSTPRAPGPPPSILTPRGSTRKVPGAYFLHRTLLRSFAPRHHRWWASAIWTARRTRRTPPYTDHHSRSTVRSARPVVARQVRPRARRRSPTLCGRTGRSSMGRSSASARTAGLTPIRFRSAASGLSSTSSTWWHRFGCVRILQAHSAARSTRGRSGCGTRSG